MTDAPKPSEPKPGKSKPKLTPQERARRKRRRAWIPTGIIGGLIIIAVVVALAIQNSGSGKVVVEKAGDTVFNSAGIAEMQKDADAQIDVRGPRSASTIDLPSDGTTKFGPFPGISTELDLVGKHGTDSIYVDSFRVTTRGDLLTSITTTSREFDFADLFNQLEAETVLGISTHEMAAFENAMPVGAGGPKSFFTLKVGTGTDLGVPTLVSVSCAGPKGCNVMTSTTLQTK